MTIPVNQSQSPGASQLGLRTTNPDRLVGELLDAVFLDW